MCCEETQHPALMEASQGCAETASKASALAAKALWRRDVAMKVAG
jgi:hypothetical protein